MYDKYGAIVRGDTTRKQIALVFTAHEFAEGAGRIIQTLHAQRAKGSFFLTGSFYANPAYQWIIDTLKQHEHYLGAHSDGHLLYCDWNNRDSLLIGRETFDNDLDANYKKMEPFAIQRNDALYFIPPYEWYNRTITEWARSAGLQLVNFTPGLRTAADYTYPEMGERYLSSQQIFDSVLAFENSRPDALNGFMILIHMGTDTRRKDKFYERLEELMIVLKMKGYSFVPVSELLDQTAGDGDTYTGK